MLRRLMDILSCPLCRKDLRLTVQKQRGVERAKGPFPGCRRYCEYRSLALDPTNRALAHTRCADCYRHDVEEGDLTCGSGHRFQILRSVPRFNLESLEKARTKKTFDVEWSTFHYGKRIYGHSREEELQDFFLRTTVNDVFLRGKTVLDAGCGIGRLSQSVAGHAKEVVGMDFSEGTEEAFVRNREAVNVHIVQGDILHPPFRDDSFDFVYSKGVLHYVSNVEVSLAALATVVKPGGSLAVTINPPLSRTFESFNNGLRRITLKLPIATVVLLSHACVPLLEIAWLWSGLKRRRIEWKERAHMIFNWLSSEHLNTASAEHMRERFDALRFDDIRLSRIPIGILGKKSKIQDSGIEESGDSDIQASSPLPAPVANNEEPSGSQGHNPSGSA